MRKLILGVAAAAVLSTAVVLSVTIGTNPNSSGAADHLDAPLVKTDGRIDINDVYVFRSPANPDNTVLVMTVNPAAGVLSPTTLRPGARYEFAIDNDGDAEEDIVYRLKSSGAGPGGVQHLVLKRATGEQAKHGGGGAVVANGRGGTAVPVSGGGSLSVDLRDDPFFFDLVSFNAGATFCPSDPAPDFFHDFNATAIVLEVPTDQLVDESSGIGVWGRTIVHGKQIERMGRPAINTVFIPPNPFEPSPPDPALEDAFNAGQPADDQAAFRGEVVDSLSLLFSLNNGSGDDPSDDAATVEALADFLLPDILTIDTASPAAFPNGRAPADDVIDTELGLITEGLITTDCVDTNDNPFSASFPYLAPPN